MIVGLNVSAPKNYMK